MEIGLAIWIAITPVFGVFFHVYFLRGFLLKKQFIKTFGEKDCFVQWFTEEGHFDLSPYMKEEGVNIILGKGRVALHRVLTLKSELPKYITYCTVMIDTKLSDGIYGSGWVIAALKPNVLLPKGKPLKDVSSLYLPKHVPEAIEVIGGKAYLHFPLNNWFGNKGIKNAYLYSTQNM